MDFSLKMHKMNGLLLCEILLRLGEQSAAVGSIRTITMYSTDQCAKHRGNTVWDSDMKAGLHNIVQACPLCEKEKR
jgi:hypothetical protein